MVSTWREAVIVAVAVMYSLVIAFLLFFGGLFILCPVCTWG